MRTNLNHHKNQALNKSVDIQHEDGKLLASLTDAAGKLKREQSGKRPGDLKYIQFIAKDMDKHGVNVDQAMRNLFIPQSNYVPKKPPATKHGGFEALFLQNSSNNDYTSTIRSTGAPTAGSDVMRRRNNTALNQTISTTGYLYGSQSKACQENHLHGRTCSKHKNVDLAELQSTAFKYLILQKPKESKPIVPPRLGIVEPKKCQASFFP